MTCLNGPEVVDKKHASFVSVSFGARGNILSQASSNMRKHMKSNVKLLQHVPVTTSGKSKTHSMSKTVQGTNSKSRPVAVAVMRDCLESGPRKEPHPSGDPDRRSMS